MVRGSTVDRSFLNITIQPTLEKCLNSVIILWSHTSNADVNKWAPNHFVPLVPADLVTNPASKREQSMVRADDTPPEKKKKARAKMQLRRKDTLGRFFIKASFNLQWTKTWPCIVSSKESKHSFCCTLCNKMLSCGKQGITDMKRHVETNSHLKNVKGSKKQVTLLQACVQAQNNKEKVVK